MNHELSTMNFPLLLPLFTMIYEPSTMNPFCHNNFTIKKFNLKTSSMSIKTLPLHRFLLEMLKKARSSFLIKWFNR